MREAYPYTLISYEGGMVPHLADAALNCTTLYLIDVAIEYQVSARQVAPPLSQRRFLRRNPRRVVVHPAHPLHASRWPFAVSR